MMNERACQGSGEAVEKHHGMVNDASSKSGSPGFYIWALRDEKSEPREFTIGFCEGKRVNPASLPLDPAKGKEGKEWIPRVYHWTLRREKNESRELVYYWTLRGEKSESREFTIEPCEGKRVNSASLLLDPARGKERILRVYHWTLRGEKSESCVPVRETTEGTFIAVNVVRLLFVCSDAVHCSRSCIVSCTCPRHMNVLAHTTYHATVTWLMKTQDRQRPSERKSNPGLRQRCNRSGATLFLYAPEIFWSSRTVERKWILCLLVTALRSGPKPLRNVVNSMHRVLLAVRVIRLSTNYTNGLGFHPTEIRTSISPSSVVWLNTTGALANYTTEAGSYSQVQIAPVRPSFHPPPQRTSSVQKEQRENVSEGSALGHFQDINHCAPFRSTTGRILMESPLEIRDTEDSALLTDATAGGVTGARSVLQFQISGTNSEMDTQT
uniref:Uncharacterized protein n=1 Tax=Timema tahoe TaxID=61484 RepID=A0A7R9NY32_9NEOP|nr:unnamed protein product [Timema tahoe]